MARHGTPHKCFPSLCWTAVNGGREHAWSIGPLPGPLPDECCAKWTVHINLLRPFLWKPALTLGHTDTTKSGSERHVLSWANVVILHCFYGYFRNVCFPHWTSNSNSHIYQQGSSFTRTPDLWVSSVGWKKAAYPLMDLLPRGLRTRLEPAQQNKRSGALCSN